MAEIKLRICDELKESLKKIAEIDKRSLNKSIELMLEDAVDNYKAKQRKNQKRIRVNFEDL